jgi:hypothetical protein
MFEECFSMIELNALTEIAEVVSPDMPVNPEFEDLNTLLVSALEEALGGEDDSLFSIH